jgi:hypothetical protein
MARPRALICEGWYRRLTGRRAAAGRSWARALREADRCQMPYESACAHFELGRHLADDVHLALAAAGFRALGCHAEADRIDPPAPC